MAPREKSKFGAPMFEPKVFQKQIYCTEESTCDIVGTFRHSSHSFGTWGIESPDLHCYVPVSTWQESVRETLRKLQYWSLPIFL